MRFAHEYFRRGQPELLHKITRITKAQEPTSSEMKSLKDDIFALKKDIVSLSNRFDSRLQTLTTALENDNKQRMRNIALSYQALSALSNQLFASRSDAVTPSEQVKSDHDVSSAVAIPKEVGEVCVKTTSALQTPECVKQTRIATPPISESPDSTASRTCNSETEIESALPKSQLMSPLMTLSGIATAMINNTSDQ